jgi:hypothetical protein
LLINRLRLAIKSSLPMGSCRMNVKAFGKSVNFQ